MIRPFELHSAPPVKLELKWGMKIAGQNYPKKLHNFRIVSRKRDSLNFIRLDNVHEALGEEKPTSVPIRLLSDDPQENLALFRGYFNKAGHLGCGTPYGEEKALRRFEEVDGRRKMADEPYEVDCSAECKYWKNGDCDLTSVLYFQLDPDLPHSGELGCARIKGTHAQRRTMSSLEIIHKQTGGYLANLPLQVSIHYESVRAMNRETYSVPFITVQPSVGMDRFYDALERELERRRRINEITGRESLKIDNVLGDVSSRKSVFDVVEETAGETEGELEEEVESFSFDGKVKGLLDELPKRKKEMVIEQFSDSSGQPDVEAIENHLVKEKERKKKAPSIDDF